ncbi:MAG: GNAT family N-acetyltransferase [Chloroflexota bacterium]
MQTAIYRNLGDNLIRRQATKADANAIGDFIAKHHYDTLGVSMRDWMLQDTPLLSASDVVLVEDTTNGNIVSSAALFNRTWRYGDIEFGVGLSESVATEEVYRGRGLMRAVYNGLHQLSAAKGQLVQTVVGIPYFYRHFGYEYALDEHNTRTVHLSDVPTLREGESELFTIRPATLEDISTLAQLYERQCQDRVVIMVRDEATWRFLITDASLGALTISLFCILDADGNTVGYFGTWGKRAGGYDMIREIAVVDGVSLHNVLPTVLRSIKAHVLQASANNPDWTPTKIFFSLGIDHAVYDVLGNKISPHRPSN